ncbi:hypothetical protein FOQG_05958 [Fusarium oxysporum f. sp. raphani 54005]|uniref:Uncharacterized protein n=3 Tax=Fusarium oxysporum TaxID=5507 RepID=X0DBM4_FUSOX|nr:hypothetical protein FOVG_06877 [Fusarium oxysporum f. sp. pisi HDV247]EXK91972.1 hypothetical protein FOQG_05958 [Fusarium oxysporum f. sp. raphani 54005]EXL79111.1 hypothetical protein FOPG_06868 [Fusarium oxysporum f. sp. conglutinans race 2 54008]
MSISKNSILHPNNMTLVTSLSDRQCHLAPSLVSKSTEICTVSHGYRHHDMETLKV